MRGRENSHAILKKVYVAFLLFMCAILVFGLAQGDLRGKANKAII